MYCHTPETEGSKPGRYSRAAPFLYQQILTASSGNEEAVWGGIPSLRYEGVKDLGGCLVKAQEGCHQNKVAVHCSS